MQGMAVYPGTFDPLTLGHLDLIQRCSQCFEEVVIAVAAGNPKVNGMFPVEERMAMAREAIAGLPRARVDRLDGLLVNYCRKIEARLVIRGLRAYSDFEYEFQMALSNRKLAPEIETLFMMPKEEYSYVSSSIVREVARHGGDARDFVPECVYRRIKKRFDQEPGENTAHAR